jgi:carbamoyl-phosphate synthase large subunit
VKRFGDPRLTIAVSGLSASENPGPGAGVIRCLRAGLAHDARVIGLAYDNLESAIFDPCLADEVYLLPYPSAGREALRGRLGQVVAEAGVDVLIPTLDAELPFMVDLAGFLGELGVRTLLPTAPQLASRDKARLQELCATCGVATPRTRVLEALSDLPGAFDDICAPVVVKGPYYDARVCVSIDEAEAATHAIAAIWGTPVLVQEHIDGEEYDVAVLCGGGGAMAGAVPMKKMLMTEKGKAWGGITVADPELIAVADRIVSALRWRGPCEIELIRRRKDGRLFLVEMNPRFPAWIYLAAAAGQNLPEHCVRLALGLCASPLPPHRPGVMFVRTVRDQIVDMRELETLAVSGSFARTVRTDDPAAI